MKNVREILNHKGDEAWTVEPGATVFQALQRMAEKDIGAILVMQGEEVVGIFSERDYARKIVLREKRSKETEVREMMSPRVLCVAPERTVEECMALMTEKRVRHLPVVEDGKLAGVVSIGDVVKAMISERQFLMEQLESYIRGV
jgi:CBS domain-containing protein